MVSTSSITSSSLRRADGHPIAAALGAAAREDFTTDARFDNPRVPQIRLQNFGIDRLVEVGTRVRELFADGATDPDRVRRVVNDAYIRDLRWHGRD
ncbi:MAG: BREX system ATP-binding domain-containing protein [Gordonia sp. (in: high G+C Gram-positive bacteria)]|uniref:BREX system ATP-binding domain-containing protein n=1 Tax=Gordonia sp. (in: high G+C Gram-positive bacteria) TaxID=84139 RepID=UPI003C70B092